jgi:hypothetical protein
VPDLGDQMAIATDLAAAPLSDRYRALNGAAAPFYQPYN